MTKAQSYGHEKAIFLSGGIGIFQSSSSEGAVSKYLPNILLQGGLGIPLNNHLYFYNRISYSSKSNFTAYEQLEPTSSLIQTTASFSQLIYNSGLRYGIFLSSRWILAFSAGFTYSLVNDEVILRGETYQKLDNQSLYGYFGGIDLEHKFNDSNFSMFGEAQYNHIGNNNLYYRDKFSGMNITAGVRFYFFK
jgi:hypothetical protein